MKTGGKPFGRASSADSAAMRQTLVTILGGCEVGGRVGKKKRWKKKKKGEGWVFCSKLVYTLIFPSPEFLFIKKLLFAAEYLSVSMTVTALVFDGNCLRRKMYRIDSMMNRLGNTCLNRHEILMHTLKGVVFLDIIQGRCNLFSPCLSIFIREKMQIRQIWYYVQRGGGRYIFSPFFF